LLLAPFVYLGIHTVQAVSQVQPGPKAAVAEYLKDTGHDKGPILVWGHRGVVSAYLPEARVINASRWPGDEEIEAVIVDVNVAKRRPSPEVEEYLAENGDEFPLTYTGGPIEVYTRKPDG
jgi:hypothetical protein